MLETSNEETIRRAFEARQIDVAARAALQAYGDEILGFLSARVRSPSDAVEIFSMFAEDMWTGLPAFEWRSSIRTWLYTLARNATSRYMGAPQKRAAHNIPLSDVASVSVLAERLRSATDAYQRTAMKDRFRQLREELDDDDQTLLILRVDRGLSWRDLAMAMSGRTDLDEDALTREAARLRKAFERVKAELRRLAEREGLVPRDD